MIWPHPELQHGFIHNIMRLWLQVLSKFVGSGHHKIRFVLPLMQHNHPMTRVAGIWAVMDAVRNLVSGILWNSQQDQPTVPRCLHDPDRRYG